MNKQKYQAVKELRRKYALKDDNVNEDIIANVVNRKFDNKEHLEIIVSDLTYVRVDNKWHYIYV